MDEPKGILTTPAAPQRVTPEEVSAFLRDELATQILCALIARRSGLVEPSLWALAYEMADARATFAAGVTVEHAEPSQCDHVVMRATPGPCSEPALLEATASQR